MAGGACTWLSDKKECPVEPFFFLAAVFGPEACPEVRKIDDHAVHEPWACCLAIMEIFGVVRDEHRDKHRQSQCVIFASTPVLSTSGWVG